MDLLAEHGANESEAVSNLLKDEDADYVDKANAVRDVFDYFVWRKEDDFFDSVLVSDISRK